MFITAKHCQEFIGKDFQDISTIISSCKVDIFIKYSWHSLSVKRTVMFPHLIIPDNCILFRQHSLTETNEFRISLTLRNSRTRNLGPCSAKQLKWHRSTTSLVCLKMTCTFWTYQFHETDMHTGRMIDGVTVFYSQVGFAKSQSGMPTNTSMTSISIVMFLFRHHSQHRERTVVGDEISFSNLSFRQYAVIMGDFGVICLRYWQRRRLMANLSAVLLKFVYSRKQSGQSCCHNQNLALTLTIFFRTWKKLRVLCHNNNVNYFRTSSTDFSALDILGCPKWYYHLLGIDFYFNNSMHLWNFFKIQSIVRAHIFV